MNRQQKDAIDDPTRPSAVPPVQPPVQQFPILPATPIEDGRTEDDFSGNGDDDSDWGFGSDNEPVQEPGVFDEFAFAPETPTPLTADLPSFSPAPSLMLPRGLPVSSHSPSVMLPRGLPSSSPASSTVMPSSSSSSSPAPKLDYFSLFRASNLSSPTASTSSPSGLSRSSSPIVPPLPISQLHTEAKGVQLLQSWVRYMLDANKDPRLAPLKLNAGGGFMNQHQLFLNALRGYRLQSEREIFFKSEFLESGKPNPDFIAYIKKFNTALFCRETSKLALSRSVSLIKIIYLVLDAIDELRKNNKNEKADKLFSKLNKMCQGWVSNASEANKFSSKYIRQHIKSEYGIKSKMKDIKNHAKNIDECSTEIRELNDLTNNPKDSDQLLQAFQKKYFKNAASDFPPGQNKEAWRARVVLVASTLLAKRDYVSLLPKQPQVDFEALNAFCNGYNADNKLAFCEKVSQALTQGDIFFSQSLFKYVMLQGHIQKHTQFTKNLYADGATPEMLQAFCDNTPSDYSEATSYIGALRQNVESIDAPLATPPLRTRTASPMSSSSTTLAETPTAIPPEVPSPRTQAGFWVNPDQQPALPTSEDSEESEDKAASQPAPRSS